MRDNAYKVHIPEGQSGNYAIRKFTVTEEQARMENIRACFGGGRRIHPGDYTKLVRGSTIVMSDTPMEIYDHMEFIRRATGNVLINGLGIGMCLKAVLDKKEVTSVIVVEISEDVIKLVGPSYANDKRLKIINDDAFLYPPEKGVRFNAVWHDIWDYITSDNLKEMSKLHRKYGRIADWQGSWCQYECRYKRQRGY